MTRKIKCIAGEIARRAVELLAIVGVCIVAIIVLLVGIPLKLCTGEQFLSFIDGLIHIINKVDEAIDNWVR